jgi:hypothetical protein
MKVKSVKQTKQPNYPTFGYYVENPELLFRNVPENWIRNKYVATSLAAFILMGTPKSKVFANSPTIEIIDIISSDEKEQNVADKQDSIKVAPIFVHGKGTGGIGCIVMSPPVFISEDEARKIIFEAMMKLGVSFDSKDCPTIKFSAPAIASHCYDDKNVSDANVELKMDGYNSELNLVIQYVSSDDFSKFRSDDGCFSSVMGFDTKEAAEIIREKLIAEGKNNAAVFYDPLAHIDLGRNNNWRKSEKEAKAEAEKLLLKQVEDFIKWLRQEKIIEK